MSHQQKGNKGSASGSSSNNWRTLALVSSVIGGGVVGNDYATGFSTDPIFGAVIGATISAVITNSLLYAVSTKGQEAITKFFVKLFVIAGFFAGTCLVATGASFWEGLSGIVFTVGVVMGAGYILARGVASALIFLAFLLLLLSRGPIGLFLRNVILNENDAQLLDGLVAELLKDTLDARHYTALIALGL